MNDHDVVEQLACLLAEERALRVDTALLYETEVADHREARDLAEKVGWERNDAWNRNRDLREELKAVYEAYRDLCRAVADFLPAFDAWAEEKDYHGDGWYTAALRSAAKKAGAL